MRLIRKFLTSKLLNNESGQSLPLVAALLTGFLGVAGLTIDLGHCYVVRSELQNSSNAAALAAAGAVYNTDSSDNATAYANDYSSQAKGNANFDSKLGTVSTTVTPTRLNLLCGGTCPSSSPNNAVKVTQSVSVPTWFMRVFGINAVTVSTTATSSMQGTPKPWNVAIILDATPSMGSTDPYCTGHTSYTAEQCALAGIQTMLQGINPCDGAASCSVTSADALFRVSLFSFPNVTTATVKDDYCSGSGTPTEAAYTLPAIPTAGQTAGYKPITYTNGGSSFTATYQVTPPNVGNADANGFLSDFYSASSSTDLNSSSIMVKAVGNGTNNGCLKPPTGFSGSGGQTYFAGAIYAAQAALQAEQSLVASYGITSNNAIIFVSDGQANTGYNRYPQVTSTASTAGNAGVGGLSATYYPSRGNPTHNLTGSGSVGTYPDYTDDCQQAIMAAQYVKSLGTRFYSVAYGSEKNGCTTDTSTVASGTLNVAINSYSDVIPCLVMENMASPVPGSDFWYFYTDGSSVANGCSDTSHTSTNLSSIFGAIGATFTNPRLLPNNAQ